MEQRNHSPLPFRHIKTDIIKGYIHDDNQKLVGHIYSVADRNFLLAAGNNYYDLTDALQSALGVLTKVEEDCKNGDKVSLDEIIKLKKQIKAVLA